MRWTLGGLRFVTVALLVLLLFKPLLDTTSQRIEKPIVVFALDNSSSIRNTADSNFYMNEFLNQWKQIQTQLGEDVEVHAAPVRDAFLISNISKKTDVALTGSARTSRGITVASSLPGANRILTRGINDVELVALNDVILIVSDATFFSYPPLD